MTNYEPGSPQLGGQSYSHAEQVPQQTAATSHPSTIASERPNSASSLYARPTSLALRVTLPPTPPMQPDTLADGVNSPLTISSQSSFAQDPVYRLGQTLNNLDPHAQRQTTVAAATSNSAADAGLPDVSKRHSLPSNITSSPFGSGTYADSPYASSPGGASVRSYYSADASEYSTHGLHANPPLTSNFSISHPPVLTSSHASGFGPIRTSTPTQTLPSVYSQTQQYTHQHHHYISASSASTFSQSQDRYICPTCNKAFSRPSSLRIHSHSHSGEKPFRCSHMGCGKAFSVRSNMKRHERGCHVANGGDTLM